MSIEETMAALRIEGAVAILRTAREDAVLPALRAAADAGFRFLEVTLNTPGALRAIRELSRDPRLRVGAGTVLSTGDAAAAVEAGAEFLVSPVADPDLIRWASARDRLVIPGAFTPAEMLGAVRAGAPAVKLFPAPPDGPGYLRTVLGPLPRLKVVPTSGVTGDNAAEFLRAGAFAVGFVNVLFDPEDLEAGRFDAVGERAGRFLGTVRAALADGEE